MKKLIVIAATTTALCVVHLSAFACEDWQEWKTDVRTVSTKDAHWDGESLSVRYWSGDELPNGALELTYWTASGAEYTARDTRSLLGSRGYGDSWETFQVSLKYAPEKYTLKSKRGGCVQVREPTFWEKVM